MSGIFGKKKTVSVSSAAPQYTGLQLQTASNAMAAPILWGTNRIAPNLIWYDGFHAVPHTTTQQTGGGKGGGGSSTTSTTYTYQVNVILALCEGPVVSIGTVWLSKQVTTLGATNFTLFTGTTPQAVWGFLSTNYPAAALPYNGIAYLGGAGIGLGDSPNLPNHNFEVHAYLSGTMADVGLPDDADPALVIQDFLTNDSYGCYFTDLLLDLTTLLGGTGSSSVEAYCKAMGLGISPAVISQEAASSLLERWLQIINTAVWWSGDVLKFKPYADSDVAGAGGWTYIAAVSPIYDLTDVDFIPGDDDPVMVMRNDPADAYNIMTLEIFDRANEYAASPIIAREESAIQLYGTRPMPVFTAHEICEQSVGAISSQLMLQRIVYIRNTFEFRLSWEYVLLEPMDIVTITDTNLGLSNYQVRIIGIDEGDDGVLVFTAEEFPQGVSAVTLYPKQGSSGNTINTGVTPARVNPPIIFEPPSTVIVDGVLQVWAAVSGGTLGVVDPNWGGADVYLSTDNATYTKQTQQVTAPSRTGFASAALAAYTGVNPDNTNTLKVDLSESAGELISVTSADAAAGVTLCYIDGELLSFTTATLTGPNQYDLTGLYRGLYGTTPGAHLSGVDFARLDLATYKFAYPASYVGQTIYVKFLSFNVWGLGQELLSDAVAYTFSPTGASGNILTDPLFNLLASGAIVDLGLSTEPVTQSGDLGASNSVSSGTIDLGATT